MENKKKSTERCWSKPRLLLMLSNFYWCVDDLRNYHLSKPETSRQIRLWLDKYLKRETFKARAKRKDKKEQ